MVYLKLLLNNMIEYFKKYKLFIEKYKIFIGTIGILFWIVIFIIYYPESMKKENLQYKEWEKSLIDLNYESLCIITNKDWKVVMGTHGDGWASVKRLYVNGKIINPDSLNGKEEFIIKSCNNYYYLYNSRNGGEDSIIYKFKSPILYEIYNNKNMRISSSNRFYQKKELMKKYKLRLPRCWD